MKKILILFMVLCACVYAGFIPSNSGGGGTDGSGTEGNVVVWDAANALTDIDVNETDLLNLRTITSVVGTEFGEKTFDDIVTGEWLYDVCINGDTGSDTSGDGSWASPFKTIQHAIDLLPKNVDTSYFYINVDDGTYSLAPYYTDLTDYKTALVELVGFYGKGQINFTFTDGAILKLTGAHDTDVSSATIFSVGRNSCKIFIDGDSTLLSLEETACPANLHNKFFSVYDSYVDIDDFLLEVNQTYSAGGDATYDFYTSGYGYLAVANCVYTVGKEGYRTFYGLNNSMPVITDGKLTGATALFGYGTTNAYFLSDTKYYNVIDAGLYIDKTDTTDARVVPIEEIDSWVEGVGVDTITASATEPSSPTEGDIWIDTSYVYRQSLSGSASSDTTINLLGGARITYYTLTISGDVTSETPVFNGGKTPEDGDSLIIRVVASGAARTLDFLEGGNGSFAYGSTLVSTDITQTVQNKTDYIGCVWDANKNKWLILSYSKGY